MRRSRPIVSVVVLAATLALSGCAGGGDTEADGDPIAAEDGVVALVGTDRLRFDHEAVTADAGELTVELTCENAVNHNIVVDGEVIAECAPGQTGTGTATFDAGTYEYVCTIPGHERTMRGTLTVS